MKKKHIILILLVFIFFLPVAGSWLFFFTLNQSQSSVNHGELLDPLIAFSSLNAKDISNTGFIAPSDDNDSSTWVLFYLVPESCNEDCEYNLYKVRQIPRSLGKDEDRVLRLAIFSSALQAEKFKDLIAQKFQFAEIHPTTLSPEMHINNLYISDPHGNILMRYPADIDPKAIFKDLQRLLKVSKIG